MLLSGNCCEPGKFSGIDQRHTRPVRLDEIDTGRVDTRIGVCPPQHLRLPLAVKRFRDRGR